MLLVIMSSRYTLRRQRTRELDHVLTAARVVNSTSVLPWSARHSTLTVSRRCLASPHARPREYNGWTSRLQYLFLNDSQPNCGSFPSFPPLPTPCQTRCSSMWPSSSPMAHRVEVANSWHSCSRLKQASAHFVNPDARHPSV